MENFSYVTQYNIFMLRFKEKVFKNNEARNVGYDRCGPWWFFATKRGLRSTFGGRLECLRDEIPQVEEPLQLDLVLLLQLRHVRELTCGVRVRVSEEVGPLGPHRIGVNEPELAIAVLPLRFAGDDLRHGLHTAVILENDVDVQNLLPVVEPWVFEERREHLVEVDLVVHVRHADLDDLMTACRSVESACDHDLRITGDLDRRSHIRERVGHEIPHPVRRKAGWDVGEVAPCQPVLEGQPVGHGDRERSYADQRLLAQGCVLPHWFHPWWYIDFYVKIVQRFDCFTPWHTHLLGDYR